MAARPPSEIAAISGCANSCNTSSTDDDQNLNLPYDDPQSEFERSFLAFLNNNSHIWTFHDSHEELEPEPAETTTSTTSTSRFSRLTSLGSRLRSHSNYYINRTTSSRISISSAPVLVRAYTGPRARDVSRARSLADSFISSAAMRGRPLSSSGGRTGGGGVVVAATQVAVPEVKLPPIADFSFDGILRAVEPEIQDALDAIAEICARSHMSMANAHGAHLPPTGEITAEPPLLLPPPPQMMPPPPPRLRHWGLGLRTDVERMTSVPEVSSSSGSASKASSASGLGRKRSAMGSLRGIMSRTREAASPHEKSVEAASSSNSNSNNSRARPPAGWVVVEDQRHPSIVLVSQALASKQLSLDTVAELPSSPPADVPTTPAAAAAVPRLQQIAPRQASSWVPWRAPVQHRQPIASSEEPRQSAENLLKGLLRDRPPGLPG